MKLNLVLITLQTFPLKVKNNGAVETKARFLSPLHASFLKTLGEGFHLTSFLFFKKSAFTLTDQFQLIQIKS